MERSCKSLLAVVAIFLFPIAVSAQTTLTAEPTSVRMSMGPTEPPVNIRLTSSHGRIRLKKSTCNGNIHEQIVSDTPKEMVFRVWPAKYGPVGVDPLCELIFENDKDQRTVPVFGNRS